MIECPICDGDGDCEHCENGSVRLDRCPRDIMGGEFIEACNVASISGKGDWPVAGGIYDQSTWFIDLYQKLKSATNRIEQESMETK